MQASIQAPFALMYVDFSQMGGSLIAFVHCCNVAAMRKLLRLRLFSHIPRMPYWPCFLPLTRHGGLLFEFTSQLKDPASTSAATIRALVLVSACSVSPGRHCGSHWL